MGVILAEVDKVIAGSYVDRMNKAVDFAKERIDERTPEDTGRLIRGTKVKKARVVGTRIEAKIYNRTEYVEHVEYGVNQRVFNYHKGRRGGPRKIIRSGVGARMFSLTKDLDENKIISIMTS